MTEITYTCSICGETFSDEYSLSQHMIQDHTTKTEVSLEGESK